MKRCIVNRYICDSNCVWGTAAKPTPIPFNALAFRPPLTNAECSPGRRYTMTVKHQIVKMESVRCTVYSYYWRLIEQHATSDD